MGDMAKIGRVLAVLAVVVMVGTVVLWAVHTFSTQLTARLPATRVTVPVHPRTTKTIPQRPEAPTPKGCASAFVAMRKVMDAYPSLSALNAAGNRAFSAASQKLLAVEASGVCPAAAANVFRQVELIPWITPTAHPADT